MPPISKPRCICAEAQNGVGYHERSQEGGLERREQWEMAGHLLWLLSKIWSGVKPPLREDAQYRFGNTLDLNCAEVLTVQTKCRDMRINAGYYNMGTECLLLC